MSRLSSGHKLKEKRVSDKIKKGDKWEKAQWRKTIEEKDKTLPKESKSVGPPAPYISLCPFGRRIDFTLCLKPGIELQSTRSNKAKYISQTACSISTRQKNVAAQPMSKWSYSSISDHQEHCKENIHWSFLTVLGNQTDKTKHKWNCDLKVFEALEIQQKNWLGSDWRLCQHLRQNSVESGLFSNGQRLMWEPGDQPFWILSVVSSLSILLSSFSCMLFLTPLLLYIISLSFLLKFTPWRLDLTRHHDSKFGKLLRLLNTVLLQSFLIIIILAVYAMMSKSSLWDHVCVFV